MLADTALGQLEAASRQDYFKEWAREKLPRVVPTFKARPPLFKLPARALQERKPYLGLQTVVDVDVYEGSLDLDKEAEKQRVEALAERLADVDFVPRQRRERFRYLDPAEYHIYGWGGMIQRVEPSPKGWYVTMRVFAGVQSPYAAITTVADYCTETYEITKAGAVTLVRFQPAPHPPIGISGS
ncbi:hypothetical protein BH23PLA1_BH23PLA1_40250 [soil metagenome]